MTASSQPDPPPEEPSYIDYEAFLAPAFSPAAFANTLVTSTNNPNDIPLDLSTPLSRVLFDAQEVDAHIDHLTTRSAAPLLRHTHEQTTASRTILGALDGQIRGLNESYRQLEREVIDKHAEADEVRVVALRLWETARLARAVGRCLQLGRQLEVQHGELRRGGAADHEDHAALVRCAYTILSLREVLGKKGQGEEGHGLTRVDAVRSLESAVVNPTERSVRETSERIVRELSIPATMTFAQGEEARARLTSAATALFLLSPTVGQNLDRWAPRLLLQALEAYIRAALQTSVAILGRALGQLPTMDKALAEVQAKCQNVASLEVILEAARTPQHPLLPDSARDDDDDEQHQHSSRSTARPATLAQYLRNHLETGSLPSYFWRTMASSMSARVQEIVSRGGVVARTLRSNKTGVGDAVRAAVLRGSEAPSAMVSGREKKDRESAGRWERESAVMVSSIVNQL